MDIPTYQTLNGLISARIEAWRKDMGILTWGSSYYEKLDDYDLYGDGAKLVASVIPEVKVDEWTDNQIAYVVVYQASRWTDTFDPKKYTGEDLTMMINLDADGGTAEDLADAVYLGLLKMEEIDGISESDRKVFDSRMEDLLEDSDHEIANPAWTPPDRTMGITKESLKI